MTTAWLFLFLLPLVHLMGHHGWGLDGARGAVLLAILAPAGLLPLSRRYPALFAQGVLKSAGLGAVLVAFALVRKQVLLPLDLRGWQVSLQLAFLGICMAWTAIGSRDRAEGPGDALWAAAWMLTGLLDPIIPFLGAGTAAALRGFGFWPSSPITREGDAPTVGLFSLALLVGLALPKPLWDFGPTFQGAWGPAAFGLGLALARFRPGWGRRLPRALCLGVIGALFVLYHPILVAPWGLMLGLAAGWAWTRHQGPTPFGDLSAGFSLGLGLSFTLHANAWVPGLRHLIWLGQ